MVDVHQSIHTKAPPSEAIARVSDLASWSSWLEGVVESRWLTEGLPDVGSRALLVRRIGPIRAHQEFEITQLDPDHSMAFQTEGPGPGRASGRFTATETDGETELRIDFTGGPRGPMRLLGPVLNRRVNREFREFLTGLKDVLESQTEGP